MFYSTALRAITLETHKYREATKTHTLNTRQVRLPSVSFFSQWWKSPGQRFFFYVWWSENLASAATGNRKEWCYIRHGSFAPLLRFPGGRLACTASPLSHPPSGVTRFDRCCPCCPVKCTCRSTQTSLTPKTKVVYRKRRKEGAGFVLTLYRREYSRAHIMSSRTTRCHDTSNPVECWKTAHFMGLWLSHPHSYIHELPFWKDLPFQSAFLKFRCRKWHCIHIRLHRWKNSNNVWGYNLQKFNPHNQLGVTSNTWSWLYIHIYRYKVGLQQ